MIIADNTKNTYTKHQLFQLCVENGAFRLINFIETEKFIELIICGVFKFSRNKETGEITQWKKLNNKKWKKTTSLPVDIEFFARRDEHWKASRWVSAACNHIVNQATTKQGKSILINGEELATTEKAECESVIGIEDKTALEITITNIIARSRKFISENDKTGAVILSRKYLWRLIDKPTYSKYIKSNRYRRAIRELSLQDYLRFIRFINTTKLSKEIEFGSLWAIIGVMSNSCKK
ncbi:hypothetical protein GBN32_01440, partial [Plesiomonas shigelloides]|uniref:hypothetical protein n=1 Tax=Plesiomonas shigelloides TaxID=703 RepID=UPI001261ED80